MVGMFKIFYAAIPLEILLKLLSLGCWLDEFCFLWNVDVFVERCGNPVFAVVDLSE